MASACRRSPPAKYRREGIVRRSQYAYPECWKYPVDAPDPAVARKHVKSSTGRFTQFGGRIPEPERSEVRARIERARKRFGFAKPAGRSASPDDTSKEKTTMAASPAQLRALARAHQARGNTRAARDMRARAASMEGRTTRRTTVRRRTTAGRHQTSYRDNPSRSRSMGGGRSGRSASRGRSTSASAHRSRSRAARSRPRDRMGRFLDNPSRAQARAAIDRALYPEAALAPAPRRRRATTRRGTTTTHRRPVDKRRVQCVAVRRGSNGRFRMNPEALLFGDNPEMGGFYDNPSPRRSRRASSSRRRSSATHRRRDARGRFLKSGRRSSTRRSSSHRSGRRYRDNPDFYDNASFSSAGRTFHDNPWESNPEISWLSIGLGIGFAALSYTLVDLLDRYIATMGKTDAWYGPDAIARIYERPGGTRIAVQLVVGLLGIGGAYWVGSRSQTAASILAGIGGGALTHVTVQLLTSWLMPKMLKAGTGKVDDKTLGNRLYPEFQDGAQAALHVLTDAEDQAAATDLSAGAYFPWAQGTTMPPQSATPSTCSTGTCGVPQAGVAGLPQRPQGGFIGRVPQPPQLPARQPSQWPQIAEEPRAGVGVAGCSSCGAGGRNMAGMPGPRPGSGPGMCGCPNCVKQRQDEAAAAQASYAAGVGNPHTYAGGSPGAMLWDVGHGAGCLCSTCVSRRAGAPRSETRQVAPCVTQEKAAPAVTTREIVMPDVEHHVTPNPPAPVRVRQGQVRVVVHETPEAPVEIAPCTAQAPAAPVSMAPPMAAPSLAPAPPVRGAAAMGTAGLPAKPSPSLADLRPRPMAPQSLRGFRHVN